MFEITTDYFAAQNPLKQALEQVPGIKRVYLSDELADVKEDRQTTPSTVSYTHLRAHET